MSCLFKLNPGQNGSLHINLELFSTCSSVLPGLLHSVWVLHQSRKLGNSYNDFDFISLGGSLKGKNTMMGLVVMSSARARTGYFKDYFCFIGFITPF